MDGISGFQPFDNGVGDWTDFGVANPAYVDPAWAPAATFDATAGAFPMQDSHLIAFHPADLQALPVPIPITSHDAENVPRRRKQNRSCDQCRVSKKACDLTPPASSASAQNEAPQTCGMCRARGIKCTSTWLDRKKRTERVAVAKRVARMTAQESGKSKPAPSLELMPLVSEVALGRPMIAQDVLTRQLDLYVEAFEMPMAQCLIQGGLPPNCSYGLDALIHLRGGGHLNQISYQRDDWNNDSNSAEEEVGGAETVRKAAFLFQATGLLDAIFQTRGVAVSPNRTTSITEGYKWVAVATAAQYCFSLGDNAGLRSRDLAYTSFQRAKDAAFGNMAATQSFRHALSMLLFGIITPPATGEEKST
ncbi:hypothetical protein NLG97_g8343 [Lecanicillium saksenae]|uniref:Uncharacterized protein n=1 Tax=Lecanicillium saksenae TaxID=468837 RepID=A0ACC1QLU3_9HYPO|nr:hypothetical protein NLG97_g8343 [Lecanicillium saksenae]